MASLESRIEALEKRLESLEAPEPYLVFQVDSQEQQDELAALHAGRKIIFCYTVCGRKDCDTCQTRGGFGCRHKEPTP